MGKQTLNSLSRAKTGNSWDRSRFGNLLENLPGIIIQLVDAGKDRYAVVGWM